jgi:cation diffusion facilitator family transporter
MSEKADFNPLSLLSRALLAPQSARTYRLGCVTVALLCLMVVEVAAGAWLGSIGLLADGLHLLFHSIAMLVALYGVLHAKRSATFSFSYGFARYEVLAAFSNTVLLIFMQLFLVAGVAHRLIEPEAFSRDTRAGGTKLLLGSAGVCLNVWAVLMLGIGPREQLARFQSASSGGSGGSSGAERQRGGGGGGGGGGGSVGASAPFHLAAAPPASAAWEGGAALQVYSDAVSSALLVASALGAPYIGGASADALQALASAAFTLHLAAPLAQATALCLLQGVPPAAAGALERAARDVSAVEGVLEVMNAHFWVQSPGHNVCTVVLRVRREANEGAVLAAAQAIYGRLAADCTIQVQKDVELGDWRSIGAGEGAPAAVTVAHAPPAAGGHGHAHGGKACAHAH